VRYIFSFLFLVLSYNGFSQKLALEFFGGGANYQGDLQEKSLTFEGSRYALGIGASYMLTDRLSARSMLTWSKISADDKNNSDPMLVERNLNFTNSVVEFNLVGQMHLFRTLEGRINPYVMAGVAIFSHNPYTFDALGTKYYLKPLSTEGQGLVQYPDVKEYKLTQFAIPFGGGVKFKVTERISLGWEIGARKTFTDYLDDVSGRYVDRTTLQAERGQKSVELAFRTPEIKAGTPYPDDQTIRGGAKQDDWYYYSGLTITYRFIPRSELTFNGKKASPTACPRPVY
jgi:opacity protein-like surface antigen